MTKLILRLLAVILSVYLAGTFFPLFASVHPPAPTTAPTAPPTPKAPPPPAATGPAQLDQKLAMGPSGTPAVDLYGGCGGCGGSGLAPSDPEGDKIRQQIAELKTQAAVYRSTAESYEKSADNMRKRYEAAGKRGGGLNKEDMEYLEKNTVSTATGFRGTGYEKANESIKKEIDEFEDRDPQTHKDKPWYKTSWHNVRDAGFRAATTSYGMVKGGTLKVDNPSYRAGYYLTEVGRCIRFANILRQKADAMDRQIESLENSLKK